MTNNQITQFQITDQLTMDNFNQRINETNTALQNKLGGIESTDYPGCYYRTVDGVTEWVNPPMILGVEYRTTERYLGKPVYVMVVDCGVAPSKSETWIKINKEISRFISIDAVSYASDTYQTTIPDSVESCKAVLVMSSQSPYILVKTTTDNFAVNGYHVYARIKYTKSTD